MSLQKEYESYLAHHGVPGMKWGIRKEAERKQKKKKRGIKVERLSAYKNRSLLSNKSLEQRIKRLEQEKKLRQLTESETSYGKSKVKEVLEDVGKKSATAVLSGLTIGGTWYLLSRVLGGSSTNLPFLDFAMRGAK